MTTGFAEEGLTSERLTTGCLRRFGEDVLQGRLRHRSPLRPALLLQAEPEKLDIRGVARPDCVFEANQEGFARHRVSGTHAIERPAEVYKIFEFWRS